MQTFETHYMASTGHRIFRRSLVPDAPVLSGVLVIHGLGDHVARHERHLQAFVRRGVICSGIDLPGHGRSEGRRGHIDKMETVLQLLDEAVEHLRQQLPAGAPIGIWDIPWAGFSHSITWRNGRASSITRGSARP